MSFLLLLFSPLIDGLDQWKAWFTGFHTRERLQVQPTKSFRENHSLTAAGPISVSDFKNEREILFSEWCQLTVEINEIFYCLFINKFYQIKMIMLTCLHPWTKFWSKIYINTARKTNWAMSMAHICHALELWVFCHKTKKNHLISTAMVNKSYSTSVTLIRGQCLL